jgi:DNA integrity scanning protein DisA with diadenylate cyclase activity
MGLDSLSVTDAVDLLCLFVLAWGLVARLYRSRAHVALMGLGVLGCGYALARTSDLELTSWFLRGACGVGAALLVLGYQDPLRRLLESIGSLGTGRRARADNEAMDEMVLALAHLAEARIGALVVVTGREPLERHTKGLVPLDGRVSVPLLLSLFDASSPGHDGAVIWAGGDRIAGFAGHLPLAQADNDRGPGGTRHAAAIGLSERTDALCIAVSEERGTISLARDGQLEVVSPGDLATRLRDFLSAKPPARQPARARLLRGGAQVATAAVITASAWLVLVHGSQQDTTVLSLPIEVENMPEGWSLDGVEPATVEVTVAGPRRRVIVLQESDVAVLVEVTGLAQGRRRFRLRTEDVVAPAGLDVVGLSARRVAVRVTRGPATP